jgi:hypothetical protein
MAGLQDKPTPGSLLPWIDISAESTFNLGMIIDAGAVFSSVSNFATGVANELSRLGPFIQRKK